MGVLRISEMARRSGVPASTLRYYESVGLLPATRSSAGYRLYGDHAQQRLMFIEAAKRLRLSLSSIADLLAVWESDACASVKGRLRPALDDRIGEADAAITELQLLRDQLAAARSRLDELPDRDERCDPGCTFLSEQRDFLPGVGATPVRQAMDCTLDSPSYRDRVAQWQHVLRGCPRLRVDGGVEVVAPLDRASALASLVVAEQTCCGFLSFTLRFEATTVVMTLTAPDHAQETVHELFAISGEPS
ncbi:MerR family transcriptional regulator [Mycobacterium spongiae]|uniref:MerR family DNA-binding transcriptional regulator n=1 Tax=Mycobacterium spongiae TaxID=886343 RepID=A0A975K1J3_9MYCO|nr:MerR family transcriptional regulator [Mycobacterium spongiae]QUR69245.1 MerR family DNA-binding transcriptional regulator [Mycobacterium spongiae]